MTVRIITASLTLILAAVFVASPALARERRGKEAGQNTLEARDDQHDLWDDRADLARLVDLVDDWHRAVRNRDKTLERKVDAALAGWISAELRESRHEVGEAQRETDASRREANHEAHDARVARNHGRHGVAARESHEAQDDRRDLRDDRRDLWASEADLARTRAIATDLATLQPMFSSDMAGPSEYDRKGALLDELKVMAAREIGADHGEIHEDAGERREDRIDN
jgi:hypothetical protein